MATATFNTAIEAPEPVKKQGPIKGQIGKELIGDVPLDRENGTNTYDLDSIITTDIVFERGKTYSFNTEHNGNIKLDGNKLTLSEGAYGSVEILVSSDIKGVTPVVAGTKVSGFQATKNEYADNVTLQTNIDTTRTNWSNIITRRPIKGGEPTLS